jgi:hypothetical protein
MSNIGPSWPSCLNCLLFLLTDLPEEEALQDEKWVATSLPDKNSAGIFCLITSRQLINNTEKIPMVIVTFSEEKGYIWIALSIHQSVCGHKWYFRLEEVWPMTIEILLSSLDLLFLKW